MLKYAKHLAAAASAVAITGTIAVAGLTAASASPAGRPAARPSATRIEHFQLVSGSPTSNKASIIAAGSVFTAGGVDVQGRRNTDIVKFPGGTFRLHHSNGTGKPHFNAKTCLVSGTIRGTYQISHGTGRFAGISGHGRYVAKFLSVGRKSRGKCNMNQNAAPAALQQIINASGPLHL